MGSVEAHLVLLDHYETHFHIFDHGDPVLKKQSPWAAVAMHDAEENGETSLLFEMVEKYHNADIANQFKLSPIEFFSLSREMVTLLFTLAEKRLRAGTQSAEDADARLAAMAVKNL